MDATPLRRALGGLAAAVVVALAAAGCSRSGTETAAATTTVTAAPAETTTTTEVPLSEGRQVATFIPSVGECFDRRRTTGSGGSSSEIVLLLDCDKPHANEVFAVVTTDLKDYPGDVVLKNLAKLECPKKFEEYVGIPYETSELELAYWLPGQTAWNQGYRKTLGCLVTSGQGPKLVGSVKGAKR